MRATTRPRHTFASMRRGMSGVPYPVVTQRSRRMADRDPVILSAVRTPIGRFLGALSSLSATELGAIAVREAVKRANIPVDQVDEVILGNVVTAGEGQAPARQAALHGA